MNSEQRNASLRERNVTIRDQCKDCLLITDNTAGQTVNCIVLLEHLQRVTDQLAVVGDMSHYKDGRIVEEAREVMRKAKGES